MGGISNARSPHPHYNHLGPLTDGAISLGCHSGVPLVAMMFWALLLERWATKKDDFVIATGVNYGLVAFSNWFKSLCNLKKAMMRNRGAMKTIASF